MLRIQKDIQKFLEFSHVYMQAQNLRNRIGRMHTNVTENLEIPIGIFLIDTESKYYIIYTHTQDIKLDKQGPLQWTRTWCPINFPWRV